MPLDFFNQQKPFRTRLVCGLGIILTSALLVLGGSWPSLFTFVAILFIPTPILFLIGIVFPGFIYPRPNLRRYLAASMVLSVVCCGVEAVFLLLFAHLTKI